MHGEQSSRVVECCTLNIGRCVATFLSIFRIRQQSISNELYLHIPLVREDLSRTRLILTLELALVSLTGMLCTNDQ